MPPGIQDGTLPSEIVRTRRGRGKKKRKRNDNLLRTTTLVSSSASIPRGRDKNRVLFPSGDSERKFCLNLDGFIRWWKRIEFPFFFFSKRAWIRLIAFVSRLSLSETIILPSRSKGKRVQKSIPIYFATLPQTVLLRTAFRGARTLFFERVFKIKAIDIEIRIISETPPP